MAANFEEQQQQQEEDESQSSFSTIAHVFDQDGGGSVSPESENEPYKLISARASKHAKFSLTDQIIEFQLDPLIQKPDEELEKILEKLINEAIGKAEALTEGREVAKLGLLLFGRGLDEPVRLPMRKIEQNGAHVLMAELEKLGQSEGEDNIDKRTLLLSHPMKLIITCVCPPAGAGKTVHFDVQANFGYDDSQRIRGQNTEGELCMFFALVLGRLFLDQQMHYRGEQHAGEEDEPLMTRSSFTRFLKNKDRQQKEVAKLMDEANIQTNRKKYGIDDLEKVQALWDLKYPSTYRIVAFEHAPELKPRPIWKGQKAAKFVVALFLQDSHWDAIKRIHLFFPGLSRKYCIDCERSFKSDQYHRLCCPSRCYYCSRVGYGYPCPSDKQSPAIECQDCHRSFFSQSCFEGHKPATCRIWRRCTQCDHVYHHVNTKSHECGTSYCQRCHVEHDKKRGCFVKKINPKKQNYRICVFDVETRQNEELDDRTKLHVVNYISALITCTRCVDEGPREHCEICGQQKQLDWSEPNGDDCLAGFTEWILNAFDKKFDTLIWSHNGSRFDSHFVFHYLMSTGRFPEPSMNGLKLFEFRIQQSRRHSRLIFRDSYLLMSVPLAQLPATFGLDIQAKSYFPYLFNQPVNYNTILPHLPPESDYCAESLSKEKYQKFKEWHMANYNTPFELSKSLQDYCQNDTHILLKSLLEFRSIIMSKVTNGVDLLHMSPTLASLCMNIFKSMFMKTDQIALVPERGYERQDRASVLAIKYLEFRAMRDQIVIEHAGNGGEKSMANFKLDGWIPAENKCIEILGCFFHGCLKCYDADNELVDKRMAFDLNEATHRRINTLEHTYYQGQRLQVEIKWECEIMEELKRDAEMREFFEDLGKEKGPIDPRQAYSGGRTGPLSLLAKADKNHKISIFDIVSLYPWIQFSEPVPVGIPDIVRPEETHVNWNKPEHIPYKGLLKVRVIPPRRLGVPVLPMRMDERLLFSCCWRCAKTFRTAKTRRNHKCPHNDRERAFVTTVTHIELAESLRQGYVVDRFLRAWHYTQWSESLFADYVRLFLRLKVEASGFPASVQTEEQKLQFVSAYKDMGVDIDPANVRYNPGLRFISKICLNSLWGKFSQRNTMGQNVVIRNPSEFYKLVFDHRCEIDQIIHISEPAIRVHYTNKLNFVKEHPASNIVLSLWVTSAARLCLLKFMNQVQRCAGAKLLYTDTDSIIVRHPRGVRPLETGDLMSCMQEEYKNLDILEYCSGGAKQYGLHFRDRHSGEEKFLLRIRGITLDMRNCQDFHYRDFRAMVEKFGRNRPKQFLYKKIGPRRDSRIVIRDMTKSYLPVLQKGIVTEELDVLPFGYQ